MVNARPMPFGHLPIESLAQVVLDGYAFENFGQIHFEEGLETGDGILGERIADNRIKSLGEREGRRSQRHKGAVDVAKERIADLLQDCIFLC